MERPSVAAVWARGPVGTLHLTLNAVIIDASAEPLVESTLLMIRAGSPPTLVATARVLQTVSRTADGWRISTREIAAAAQAS